MRPGLLTCRFCQSAIPLDTALEGSTENQYGTARPSAETLSRLALRNGEFHSSPVPHGQASIFSLHGVFPCQKINMISWLRLTPLNIFRSSLVDPQLYKASQCLSLERYPLSLVQSSTWLISNS